MKDHLFLSSLLILACIAATGLLVLVMDTLRLAGKGWMDGFTRRSHQQPMALTVVRRIDFTDTLFSLELAPANQKTLPSYRAGQYLTLLLPGQTTGQIVRRAYSLASWGQRIGRYVLAIKREEGGYGSAWLHQNAREGVSLQAMPPQGQFAVRQQGVPEVVFVAGGIGITPLRAMINHLMRKPWVYFQKPRITLFYAARYERALCYREEFEALSQRWSHFRFIPIVSRPSPAWEGARGRLSATFIANTLQAPGAAHYYFCATQQMMDDLREGLVQLGISEKQLHFESFGNLPSNEDENAYRVELGTKAAFVFQGQPSLLHAMEAANILSDGDCRAGHCGNCRLKLDHGKVRQVMTPEVTVREGEILACCSVPESDLKFA